VGNSVGQVMRSLATREIPKIASLAPELPPAFATLVDGMLARERTTRLASVEPVVAAASWLLANGSPAV
jgi:hypothetical protein